MTSLHLRCASPMSRSRRYNQLCQLQCEHNLLKESGEFRCHLRHSCAPACIILLPQNHFNMAKAAARAAKAPASAPTRTSARATASRTSKNNGSNDEYSDDSSAASEGSASPSQASEGSVDASPSTYLQSPRSFLQTYPVTHNEVGVLTIEPYKSILLPHWRFKTPDIAQISADTLFQRFEDYGKERDFVGMDMARKFIQMGMTRAKRYANYKGGRKYEPAKDGKGEVKGRDGKVRGRQLEKSQGHEGKGDKEEASNIFRGYWERCKEDERYAELKSEFLEERRRLRSDEKK